MWGRCSGRARMLVALLGWGAVMVLWAPRLQTPHRTPAPFARLLLQSEPGATSSPAPSSSAPPSADDPAQFAELAALLPSLPVHYWTSHKNDKGKYYKKPACAPLPSILELEFHNTYWQSLTTSKGVFHLYGAYLDARNTSLIGRAVRILGVHDKIKPSLVTHCQLWFEENTAPTIVRVLEYKYVWNSKWGNYRDNVLQPYLMACVLPPEVAHLKPKAVSLVEQPCDRATNFLSVFYAPPPTGEPRKDFTVCVKGLDFQYTDLSVRLVEWIELINLLGADKIHFYQLQVHPNIAKVLDYYQKKGLVTVTPITLPGGQPNIPTLQHMYLKKKTTHKRQMELIPYNDCLYRNLYLYKWVVLLDIDEVIVPLEDDNWADLMKKIVPKAISDGAGKPQASSYHASNLYYLDSLRHEHGWEEGVPRYMHMLQHVWRTRNFTKTGQYIKAFHETDRVLALHNHFPLACIGGACRSYQLPEKTARLQHYRADCVTALSKTCKDLSLEPRRDPTLWKWRDQLVPAVTEVLQELKLLPNEDSFFS